MAFLTFRGGIHPYDGKDLSKNCPVEKYLPKGDLAILVSQHIGAPAKPIVKKGDHVLAGQKIAEAGGFVSAPIHSSVSGTVKGIEMLSISETAGLGMKAKEADFKDQFKDKNVKKFTYTKTGESGDDMIDAISGATITTNAVTNAVDSALVYFQNELGGGSNE